MASGRQDFATGVVAQHYNQVEQRGIRERKKSAIIELRNFNNAMKSLLQYQAIKFTNSSFPSREPLRVLDLGCGKGGDLPKYIYSGQVGLIVGVDIADVSIEQCIDRYKKHTMPRRPRGEFFVADLTRVDIGPKLKEHNCPEKFHIASSQFSIHYSFESLEQAIKYISNAANNLQKHGVFIGTYPDGPKLLKLARLSADPGVYEVDDVLSVRFSPEDLKNPKPFGTKYHFKLKEVVDCPEFLTHPEILESVMTSLGFYKVFDRSFEEQIKETHKSPADKDKFKELFEKHKALKFDFELGKATLSETMWSVASLYRCFCYRKLRDD
uniref:mRNA (guanine-N(7))-methyltransferase n=1 Tax=Aceria tosichella TaxID=561515 RepID=A0A6G1SDN2_9ACAR